VIVGVVPAAGHATRLQPLRSSKEVQPIGGRPVMDYLVERLHLGGCTEVRVVTRTEKRDVIENARRLGAVVIEARPATPAASLLSGLDGLDDGDVVAFGFPDSIWEPNDGFRRLVERVAGGADLALGLFRTANVERPDVVQATGSEPTVVTRIDVGSYAPPPHLVWGCAVARTSVLRGLRDWDDPGDLFSAICRDRPIAGAILSSSYVDIGTPRGMRIALESHAGRPDEGRQY
jgi:NDP-sugar pyrophosphorylase family protein